MDPDARALLVEMRALYIGNENRVFMSLREIMKRLSVGRCRAEKARDELLDRGFIRLLEPATFNRKTRHAPSYLLTNEPSHRGGIASKEYMRWRPEQKNTVLITSTDGVDNQHREQPNQAKKRLDDVDNQHREHPETPAVGVDNQHTDRLPSTRAKKNGWMEPGHVWKSGCGYALNTQCTHCGVWTTENGLEYDGRNHACDPVSKRAREFAANPAEGRS